MTGERQPGVQARTEARIDAVLRAVGSAAPEPGLEGRVLNRLAAARFEAHSSEPSAMGASRLRIFRPLLGVGSACLLCAVIVGGSVRYSHRYHRVIIPAAPMLQQGNGVGAASAVHPGAPASAPIPAGDSGRGRPAQHSAHGRARITPQAHKAPGVAVPAPANSPNP